MVLNTIFLVREIRRNEQHDAFINAVTHELKTPVASIRLYLETLQTRAVDEAKRRSSTASCWTTATGCWHHRAGAAHRPHGRRRRNLNLSRFDLSAVVDECVERARALHQLPPRALKYQPATPP